MIGHKTATFVTAGLSMLVASAAHADWLYPQMDLELYRVTQMQDDARRMGMYVGYPGSLPALRSKGEFRRRCAEGDPLPECPGSVFKTRYDQAEGMRYVTVLGGFCGGGAIRSDLKGWEAKTFDGSWHPASAYPDAATPPHRERLPEDRSYTGLVATNGWYDALVEQLAYVECKATSEPRLFVGESISEMLSEDPAYMEYDPTMIQVADGCWRSEHPLAFRYLRFKGEVSAVKVVPVGRNRPVIGSLVTDNARWAKMHEVAVRTLARCSDEFLIDGIKRDRLPWGGDLAVSLLADAYIYGDAEVVRRSLSVLDAFESDVNGLITYSMWLIISHDFYQLYFGDSQFLKDRWWRIKWRIENLIERTDPKTGFVVKEVKNPFIDWAAPESLTAMHAIWFGALEAAARLADRVGDSRAKDYRALAVKVRDSVNRLSWDEARGIYRANPDGKPVFGRQANVYAIIFGVADSSRAKLIGDELARNDLPPVGTPYVFGWELVALARTGHQQAFFDGLERVFGGMLDQGATTFWEGYDAAAKGDGHYAFYNRKWGKSLCHAWSAWPAILFVSEVMGIRPTADGWKTWEQRPMFKDEKFSAVIPTPQGILSSSSPVVSFEKAEPIWIATATNEINTSVTFVSSFDWDGVSPLKLKLTGCSIFKVLVNDEFAAYGPARGPHGWFRMDEWDLSKVAKKGGNRLRIEGVAYNTTTYYLIEHAPFLQAEVVAGNKVVRSTGEEGAWTAVDTCRVRKTPRYSLQRAQSEVYEVNHLWDAARRSVVGWNPVTLEIKKQPPVKLLERGAPYPNFEIDQSYRPVCALKIALRTGELGKAPRLWDVGRCSLGRTYPLTEIAFVPLEAWWRRTIEATDKAVGERCKINATSGVRYEGAINDTGFLRLKVKVTEPGRILVGFDEILVNGKLDFINRFGCCNIVTWDVKDPGEYEFESFEPYTFKYAEVIMLEGAAEVETLEMRTYKNPDATRACTFTDPADRKIFEAARETFAQNAVDVFTDCPSRERAGWLCDTYFTGPAERFFTGRNEIERTFLRNFALADEFPFQPEGMVPMCYPGDHIDKNFIPNWSMWFILELANYVERTGDRETAAMLRPRVEGLLKFYVKYLNQDGLLENLPAWVFVEWSHANVKKLVRGINWPSNMTYYEVLLRAAKLYDKPELLAQAEKLKATICERSFDGNWFRDNADHPDVTETCQYYAFFHGVATPKTHPELWSRLTKEFGPERQAKGLYREVWPSNAFIGNMLRLIVLKREGLNAQVRREVRGYYLKMAETTGTLWEHDRPSASCNHGFAAYVAMLLSDI